MNATLLLVPVAGLGLAATVTLKGVQEHCERVQATTCTQSAASVASVTTRTAQASEGQETAPTTGSVAARSLVRFLGEGQEPAVAKQVTVSRLGPGGEGPVKVISKDGECFEVAVAPDELVAGVVLSEGGPTVRVIGADGEVRVIGQDGVVVHGIHADDEILHEHPGVTVHGDHGEVKGKHGVVHVEGCAGQAPAQAAQNKQVAAQAAGVNRASALRAAELEYAAATSAFQEQAAQVRHDEEAARALERATALRAAGLEERYMALARAGQVRAAQAQGKSEVDAYTRSLERRIEALERRLAERERADTRSVPLPSTGRASGRSSRSSSGRAASRSGGAGSRSGRADAPDAPDVYFFQPDAEGRFTEVAPDVRFFRRGTAGLPEEIELEEPEAPEGFWAELELGEPDEPEGRWAEIEFEDVPEPREAREPRAPRAPRLPRAVRSPRPPSAPMATLPQGQPLPPGLAPTHPLARSRFGLRSQGDLSELAQLIDEMRAQVGELHTDLAQLREDLRHLRSSDGNERMR